jgi:predicted ArsR family transcriptional regulator
MADGVDLLVEMSDTRAAILRLLKKETVASIPQIAASLELTHEAARKQVLDLQRKGWINTDCRPEEIDSAPIGRPPAQFCLTAAGDHLFPKKYASLLIAVLDGVQSDGTTGALDEVLAHVTDERVKELSATVKTVPLRQKMDRLRSIYIADDPFTTVERRDDVFVLVERNCPYLTAALERPAICSSTVSTLRRLTGCEVIRERRFQDGDGRCEFHVYAATESATRTQQRFEPEPPKSSP